MNTVSRTVISQWKKDENAHFEGWDFSYLDGRMIEEQPPWNYMKMARALMKKSNSVLDMGTGGGEIFAKLAPFPRHSIATEGYKPNISVARKNLEKLGVKVVDFANATVRRMPFKDEEFDLMLNRHDAFDVKEVYRILNKNGSFLTQQVAEGNLIDLIKVFRSTPKYKGFTLQKTKSQLKSAGFRIEYAKTWKGHVEFKDVGAIVYFLKAIPWAVPGFTVSSHIKYLGELQQKLESEDKLKFRSVRYIVQAKKI